MVDQGQGLGRVASLPFCLFGPALAPICFEANANRPRGWSMVIALPLRTRPFA